MTLHKHGTVNSGVSHAVIMVYYYWNGYFNIEFFSLQSSDNLWLFCKRSIDRLGGEKQSDEGKLRQHEGIMRIGRRFDRCTDTTFNQSMMERDENAGDPTNGRHGVDLLLLCASCDLVRPPACSWCSGDQQGKEQSEQGTTPYLAFKRIIICNFQIGPFFTDTQ